MRQTPGIPIPLKAASKRTPWVMRVWLGIKPHLLNFFLPVPQRKEHFTKYSKLNLWGEPYSRSGHGSNLRESESVRHELPGLLLDLSVRKFLDIPCGDFYWMSEVRMPPGVFYAGGDIVWQMIRQINRRYATRRTSFWMLNILLDRLPEADLVLCRDCLVHFTLSEIAKALNNIKRSRSTYLLTTHNTECQENVELPARGWRAVNLTRPPFNFPPPLRVINEHSSEDWQRDKNLALWRLQQIPDLSAALRLPAAGRGES